MRRSVTVATPTTAAAPPTTVAASRAAPSHRRITGAEAWRRSSSCVFCAASPQDANEARQMKGTARSQRLGSMTGTASAPAAPMIPQRTKRVESARPTPVAMKLAAVRRGSGAAGSKRGGFCITEKDDRKGVGVTLGARLTYLCCGSFESARSDDTGSPDDRLYSFTRSRIISSRLSSRRFRGRGGRRARAYDVRSGRAIVEST